MGIVEKCVSQAPPTPQKITCPSGFIGFWSIFVTMGQKLLSWWISVHMIAKHQSKTAFLESPRCLNLRVRPFSFTKVKVILSLCRALCSSLCKYDKHGSVQIFWRWFFPFTLFKSAMNAWQAFPLPIDAYKGTKYFRIISPRGQSSLPLLAPSTPTPHEP